MLLCIYCLFFIFPGRLTPLILRSDGKDPEPGKIPYGCA